MNEPTIPLNSAWLRNRVAELGLKQWWLAEQIGVDKKTVIRWLHGHVRSIQLSNAVVLARVLDSTVADLESPRETLDLASADDQRAAAALLATSALLDKLGPVGEWDVIESIVKAVAVPDLPLHVLGTLYNRLCIACWRQSKIEQAEAYNRAAFDAAQRCGDKALLAGAQASRANLLHWRGHCAQAIDAYRAGLELQRFIEPPAIGALHSNLGATLYEIGEFDAGERALHEALACFRLGGTAMQLSIAHGHLAILALKRDDVALARAQTEAAEGLALQTDYRRGVAMSGLLRAEVAARVGDEVGALDALTRSLAAFARLGISEGLNHEFEGRVLRWLGRLADAQQTLQAGLRISSAFPLQHGQLHAELARTRRLQGDREGAASFAQQAIALFRACGAPRLAAAVEAEFGPDGAWC